MRSVIDKDSWPNLVTMFFDQAEKKGDAPFLGTKVGDEWQTISWREAARQVAQVAEGLLELGVRPGNRVMLISENRPEWCLADLGIMAAGAITVPAYTTNTERDHLHILEDSHARAAIVSTTKLAKAFLPAAYQSDTCELLIGIEPLSIGQSSGPQVRSWEDCFSSQPGDVAKAARLAENVKRDELACLIYTSGTGGAPRGVRQHHGAILCSTAGAYDILESDFGVTDERFLSFLPLSHAYEHTGGQFLPIMCGAEIYYSQGLDRLAANIEETGPTIMVVVPRLFEVLRQRIIKSIEKQGGAAKWMLDQALRLGEIREKKGRLPLHERPLDMLLERTIRKRVRGRMGGRLKAMVSGGAPLNPEVGLFFEALGVTLLQGYGQTEAAPVISCNRPRAGIKMHTVGPPLKGVDVRIAEDGEILVSGELVMHGYWNNPEESARTLSDGWLHTGDIGHFDQDGHIVITDRKKDLIVNDKGDNIAPQRVEGMLTLQPEILQAMVSGDKRPYLVGLVVPDPEWMAEWAGKTGKPADLLTLKDDPEFVRAVTQAVDRVNKTLATVEKVRRIIIADAQFTVENEQMTPSMKIRRHIIRGVYGERLDALYR
ncbi:long-chain fatty acid--CoA ligase [Pacificimonas flava]|uniref:Long-chain fatty acid--CoA ligase n=2 Tax=Pacificimonas TaxID=1960290 RepID=A0A219B390_9SPHN|nr:MULTISPECIES: AMP-dependent synthetase/ligase [Pacificimonas]MBZ6377736.1 long-chain fatty acid--CoA ligase [Pacificimonas aurantium]OWV32586.1 long-chain fatty acid--CoA ligase [Pacificimonas flava]